MKKSFSIFALLIIFSALIPPRLAQAQEGLQTVDIQPDESSMFDTQLMSAAPTTNYATSTDLTVGEVNNATNTGRSYLKFDLSTMPTDIDLVSATLTLTVKTDLSSNASRINVHGVKRSGALENQANWNKWKAGSDWGAPGAGSSVSDIEGAPIGDYVTTNNIAAGTEVTIILDPDAVKAMIFDDYYGFILRMETETDNAYVFYSSSDATASRRPKLHLEYYTGYQAPDVGWFCTLENLSAYDAACGEPNPNVVVSPYDSEGGHTLIHNIHLPSQDVRAVRMNCTPYPNCKNNYPIHYKIGFTSEWTSEGAAESVTFNVRLWSGSGLSLVLATDVSCGSGTSGKCSYVFEGTIPVEEIPIDDLSSAADFSVAISGMRANATGDVTEVSVFRVRFSTLPLDGGCADLYMVPVIDTYEIDETIEAPIGMVGDPTPVDEQGYPLTVDSIYMLRTQDGPWNDGAADRYDTEVSTDGTYWVDLYDWASLNGLCLETDPLQDDLVTVYFTATTEEIYIRVNDTAGNFADNYKQIFYSIGVAFEILAPPSCTAQYSYGLPDQVGMTTEVEGTSEETPVLDVVDAEIALEAGEWYAIEIVDDVFNDSGWQDPPALDDRLDLEFDIETDGQSWQDLAEGSQFVGCVSDDAMVFYVQAAVNGGLNLRVNDQDVNFADNTGSVFVKVFHAEFTPMLSGCAVGFDLGELLAEDTVEGNAADGKRFGYYPASLNEGWIDTADQSTAYLDGGLGLLIPGRWYALETTFGPWRTTVTIGDVQATVPYYNMEIQVNGGDWEPLETWSGAECISEIDALGHLRVYFQLPVDETLLSAEYKLRVATNSPPFTRGFMGWKLYQGIDIAQTTGDCGDYTYDPEEYTPGRVDGNSEGSFILGIDSFESAFYAIELQTDTTAWQEATGQPDESDLSITSNGSDYYLLPETSNVLCYFSLPGSGNLLFIIRATPGQNWQMKTPSVTPSNNTGFINYKVYNAMAGDVSQWQDCLTNQYELYTPALNENEWIPPQDEEGVYIIPTLTYTPGADPDGDGIIEWGAAGLEAGHYYAIQTQEGPWRDGETETGHYDAEVSKDNGVTWRPLDETNSTDFICVDQNMGIYYRGIFYVEEGERWKIRVGDTETATFTDNAFNFGLDSLADPESNLAYKLWLVNEFPVDGPGGLVTDYDPAAFDVCVQSLVRPQLSTVSDLNSLSNYFGDWVQYANRSMLSYFAWCPRHTDMLLSAINALKTKEPLASLYELQSIQHNIKMELNSYDWDGGLEDTSIFSADSTADVNQIFEEHVLPSGGAGFDPWEGGDLVTFNNTGLPGYYYSCGNVLTSYLPSRLADSVCFVSAYWKETGAAFWVQISLDIGALFILWGMIKSSIQSLVYMMTGVRIWTKDRALQVVVNAAETQKGRR